LFFQFFFLIIIVVKMGSSSASPYQQQLDNLKRDTFRGEILLSGDPLYEQIISSFWNNMFNGRRPAVIFRVLGASDVAKAILFAKGKSMPCAL
jgi:hypothetical protein